MAKALDCLRPVSYTHLHRRHIKRNSKRQFRVYRYETTLNEQKIKKEFGSALLEDLTDKQIIIFLEELLTSSIFRYIDLLRAVSYTHLDVYKRQVLDLAPSLWHPNLVCHMSIWTHKETASLLYKNSTFQRKPLEISGCRLMTKI